jgi:prepilin-type N-terminal cleavage/methylation domain-containing protein
MNSKILSKNHKGFTLIELIIVIVIIIILVGVGVPLTAGYITERNVYNAATQVQQDLLLVQNLSITHSTESKFKITFSDSSSYLYETDESGTKTVSRNLGSNINIYDLKIDGTSTSLSKSFNFDNQGRLHQTDVLNPCSIEVYLQLSNGTKQIKVVVSPIGRVIIDWITK